MEEKKAPPAAPGSEKQAPRWSVEGLREFFLRVPVIATIVFVFLAVGEFAHGGKEIYDFVELFHKEGKKDPIPIHDMGISAVLLRDDGKIDTLMGDDVFKMLAGNVKLASNDDKKTLMLTFDLSRSQVRDHHGFRFNFSSAFYDSLGSDKINPKPEGGWQSHLINSANMSWETNDSFFGNPINFSVEYIGHAN